MTPEDRACEIVARALKIEGGHVSIDDTMETLPAWDSLAHMSIVLTIEAETNRQLRAEEIASILSVRSVAELL